MISEYWPRVSAISMMAVYLSGTLPPVNDHVSDIFVSRNRLSGTIDSLKTIVAFGGVGNRFSGSMPRIEYMYHGKIKHFLQLLVVGENRLSGALPESYKMARELEGLILYDNPGLDIDLGLASSWPNLWYLMIQDCRIRGTLPGSWTLSTRLRAMDLEGNSFSGTLSSATFVNKSRLTTIDISGNWLSGTHSHQTAH